MLHQCDLFVQFFRVRSDIVHLHHILLLSGSYRFPLVVIESGLCCLVKKYFGRVVEKNSSCPVRQKVA